MKVLIDECAPRALKGFPLKHGHESLTAGGGALRRQKPPAWPSIRAKATPDSCLLSPCGNIQQWVLLPSPWKAKGKGSPPVAQVAQETQDEVTHVSKSSCACSGSGVAFCGPWHVQVRTPNHPCCGEHRWPAEWGSHTEGKSHSRPKLGTATGDYHERWEVRWGRLFRRHKVRGAGER